QSKPQAIVSRADNRKGNVRVLPLNNSDDKKVAIRIGTLQIKSSGQFAARAAQSIVSSTSGHTDRQPASAQCESADNRTQCQARVDTRKADQSDNIERSCHAERLQAPALRLGREQI